jgi:hypothetical protein
MSFTAEQIAKKKELKNNLELYAKTCLWIRTKHGHIEPFIFNRAQKYIHSKLEAQRGGTGMVRALILKGRQQGVSSYVGGRFFHRVTHQRGCQAFILTHLQDATDNLFKMAKRYYDHCPVWIKPDITLSNVKELRFGGIDSGYKVGTAENKSIGRSATIQLFHGSEAAFWSHADEHASGIFQAVPTLSGTEIILESTANGVGNFFHQQWQMAEAGISDYKAVFVPWYWQEEYRSEVPEDFVLSPEEIELVEHYGLTHDQLAWRRMKILNLSVSGVDGLKVFKQEYPNTSVEAFQLTGDDTYISSEIVARCRTQTNLDRYGPLIIGVDPARFGDDRTSIIRRQGRVAYSLESYCKKDTMEVTGIVHKIIQSESPTKVIIDVGGLGAGVVDRLKELGYSDLIVAANNGAKPLDEKLYYNKRAETWAQMLAWLQDTPCQIPDNDSLHADLCGIKYRFDSNTRLLMERKEDMKKRGVRSPDEADALALTFYLPSTALFKREKRATDALAAAHSQRERALAMSRGSR